MWCGPATPGELSGDVVDQERQNRIPSLPPEVWQLISLQNTNPKHLWTVGRQVCSMWRSEIPKVIAKKYLEDPGMTQIHSDREMASEMASLGLTCLMGVKTIFSHYENKTRAVFKRCPEEEEDDREHLNPEVGRRETCNCYTHK